MSDAESAEAIAQELADAENELQVLRAEQVASGLKALVPRQAAFVREYLKDLNATQACIRAGYSPNGANVTSSQLMSHPSIKSAVIRALAARAAQVNITQADVISEVNVLANSSLDHYYVDDEGQVKLADGAPPNAMGAIQSMRRKTRVYYDKNGDIDYKLHEVEIRLWDKPGQLKLLGKHTGIKSFSDRVEVTGLDGGPIAIAASELQAMSVEELQEKAKALAQALVDSPDER